MGKQYVCLNGSYHLADDPVLHSNNRSFCYGDGLFETIRCLGTEPKFMEKHLSRLLNGMSVLKMDIPKDFSKNFFTHYIERLLNKNRIFKGARVRISVFRNSGGLYTPATNKPSFLIESSAVEEEYFTLNKKGLVVDLFDEIRKPLNVFSNLKTTNALLFVMAALYRKSQGLDDCLILNERGSIIESTSSNLFLVKDTKLITPPITDGCLAGTMRTTVMELASKLNLEFLERTVVEKDLCEADEIFLTNAIQGIRWIVGYQDKRYFHFVSQKLTMELNKLAFA